MRLIASEEEIVVLPEVPAQVVEQNVLQNNITAAEVDRSVGDVEEKGTIDLI